MDKSLGELKIRIDFQKKKMSDLWSMKGETDWEVLKISTEIDQLLNQYYRLLDKR